MSVIINVLTWNWAYFIFNRKEIELLLLTDFNIIQWIGIQKKFIGYIDILDSIFRIKYHLPQILTHTHDTTIFNIKLTGIELLRSANSRYIILFQLSKIRHQWKNEWLWMKIDKLHKLRFKGNKINWRSKTILKGVVLFLFWGRKIFRASILCQEANVSTFSIVLKFVIFLGGDFLKFLPYM